MSVVHGYECCRIILCCYCELRKPRMHSKINTKKHYKLQMPFKQYSATFQCPISNTFDTLHGLTHTKLRCQQYSVSLKGLSQNSFEALISNSLKHYKNKLKQRLVTISAIHWNITRIISHKAKMPAIHWNITRTISHKAKMPAILCHIKRTTLNNVQMHHQ